MAFTGFPATYQPMYYAPQYQQPAQQQSNAGLIWVQGEAGAKSYLVAPNTTVALYDSERQTIYLKSADVSGMPSMRILDYTIRDQTASNGPMAASNSTPANTQTYATKADLDALAERINALRAELDKRTKKEDVNDG